MTTLSSIAILNEFNDRLKNLFESGSSEVKILNMLRELNSMGITAAMLHDSPLKNETIEMLSKKGSDKIKRSATKINKKWSQMCREYAFKERVKLAKAKNVDIRKTQEWVPLKRAMPVSELDCIMEPPQKKPCVEVVEPTITAAPLPEVEIRSSSNESENIVLNLVEKICNRMELETRTDYHVANDGCALRRHSKVFVGRGGKRNSESCEVMDRFRSLIHKNWRTIKGLEEVPFDVMESELVKFDPEQLQTFERNNCYFKTKTDHLWKRHVLKRNNTLELKGNQTWREAYARITEAEKTRLERTAELFKSRTMVAAEKKPQALLIDLPVRKMINNRRMR